ncbi:uroporphyrinogen-III synthase, partial [Nocardioides sp. SOB77]
MDESGGGSLDGFRIGVTASRKVEEQVALIERRGAEVVWAPALSTDPTRVDDAALRRATEAVVAQPPDLFLATTGVGMRAWLAAAEGWGLR